MAYTVSYLNLIPPLRFNWTRREGSRWKLNRFDEISTAQPEFFQSAYSREQYEGEHHDGQGFESAEASFQLVGSEGAHHLFHLSEYGPSLVRRFSVFGNAG